MDFASGRPVRRRRSRCRRPPRPRPRETDLLHRLGRRHAPEENPREDPRRLARTPSTRTRRRRSASWRLTPRSLGRSKIKEGLHAGERDAHHRRSLRQRRRIRSSRRHLAMAPGPRPGRPRLPPSPHGRRQRRRAPQVDARPPRSAPIPITAGRLDLGPWQQIFYAEFDGMRPKRVIVKILGE